MLRTHLIIKYKPKTQFGNNVGGYEQLVAVSNELLTYILSHLQGKGVEHSKIKEGCWCIGSLCVVKHSKVSIGVTFPSDSTGDKQEVIKITCVNYYSYWRHLFNRPKDEERYSGEALKEFVRLVDEAVRNNDRIAIHRDWMDRTEYLSAIKSIR